MTAESRSMGMAALTFYSLDQVTEMTGWSPSHLRRAIRAGKLITHEFGRSLRISQADLEAFLAAARRLRTTTKNPIKINGSKVRPEEVRMTYRYVSNTTMCRMAGLDASAIFQTTGDHS